jgi:CubicO group peptidase (beta-lactamase class C family)
MVRPRGRPSEPQSRIQSLLDHLTETQAEIGIQVAVYLNGESVIDAWSGVVDLESRRPVTARSLFTVYSVSKGITSTAIHLLADRNLLSYDDPIAKYWPEFSVNGKSGITIRQVLTHTAGLMRIPEEVEVNDLPDWNRMCDLMALEHPLGEPGESFSYHAVTFGWVVGGLVERVDGRSFSSFVREEFVDALGLDTLSFGVARGELLRVATLYEDPSAHLTSNRPIPRAGPPEFLSAETMNLPAIRKSCIPSHGMITNARSLARFYASLVGAGVDGRRTLSPERVAEASAAQLEFFASPDVPPVRIGLGYGLGGVDSPMSSRATAFGHGGYGGSYGFADLEQRLAVGITKNYLATRPAKESTSLIIARTVREVLGLEEN